MSQSKRSLRWIRWLATGFGLGLAPKAPGTFGTLGGAGVVGIYEIMPSTLRMPLFLLLCFGGYYVIKLYEHHHHGHDASEIVIDEILGFATAFLWIPVTLANLLVAFIWFRIFDVSKIGPVGWCERRWHGSAFGTLMDDLVAGVLTAMMLMVMIHMRIL